MSEAPGNHLSMSLDDMIKSKKDVSMKGSDGQNKGGKGGKIRT